MALNLIQIMKQVMIYSILDMLHQQEKAGLKVMVKKKKRNRQQKKKKTKICQLNRQNGRQMMHQVFVNFVV